jgi:hypothetical protein
MPGLLVPTCQCHRGWAGMLGSNAAPHATPR